MLLEWGECYKALGSIPSNQGEKPCPVAAGQSAPGSIGYCSNEILCPVKSRTFYSLFFSFLASMKVIFVVAVEMVKLCSLG